MMRQTPMARPVMMTVLTMAKTRMAKQMTEIQTVEQMMVMLTVGMLIVQPMAAKPVTTNNTYS